MAAASVAAAAASGGTVVAAIAGVSGSGAKGRLSAGNGGRGGPGGSRERRKADELSGRRSAGEAGGFSTCCHSGLGATLAVADARRAQQLALPAPPPLAAAIARVREGTNTAAAELANPRQWRMRAVSVSVRRAPGNVAAASSLPFLSDSSARSSITSAILRRAGSPAPLNDGLNRTLWAITRLANSSFPSSSSSSSSSSSPLSVAQKSPPPPPILEEDNDSSNTTRIWLSDVVAKKERAYFQRPWTGKDITYLSHMLLLHLASLAAPFTFSWDAFAVFFSLYVITGLLGITLSFHRNLSHKAFKLPKWLEYTFAYCGVQAMQGDPLEWVSSHRYHHRYCDTPQDPHSPKEGFWHSHICWLLDAARIEGRLGKRTNIADMENDSFYQFIKNTYPLHLVASSLILFAWGGLPYLIWGVALRTVFVYHITWLVNSASHVWGTQKWYTGDLSRNNWWVALLAFGEGWHNNHHAFEYSARHGLEWWELDMTWYVVKALEKMGLATNVKLPRPDQMARLSFPPSP